MCLAFKQNSFPLDSELLEGRNEDGSQNNKVILNDDS